VVLAGIAEETSIEAIVPTMTKPTMLAIRSERLMPLSRQFE
jgi:hypothetical protein